MKRIVILGDSLGMPRSGVQLEQTYPYLLQQSLVEFEIYAKHRRANDSAIQSLPQTVLDDITYFCPDILVLHLGIVDCAPRLFSRFEQRALWNLKIINKMIIGFMSKRRRFFTKVFPKVYVKISQYEQNMQALIEAGKKSAQRVIVVNIASTSVENNHKSYGFERNIKAYNAVLNRLVVSCGVELIDLNKVADKTMLDNDGIHFNIAGNALLAEQLEQYCRS